MTMLQDQPEEIQVHACEHMCVHVNTCEYMYVHVSACKRMCVHVSACAYICIHVGHSVSIQRKIKSDLIRISSNLVCSYVGNTMITSRNGPFLLN